MKKRIVLICFLTLVTLITAIPLSGCVSKKNEVRYITSVDDLSGAKIGVQTGTIFDVMAKTAVPDCTVEYFNTNNDIITSLDSGKISAYVIDKSVADQIIYTNPSFGILDSIAETVYAFAFPKDNDRAKVVCTQMNEFIAKAKTNGLLDELKNVWMSDGDENKDVDYSGLTSENGVLTLAVATDGSAPFAYLKDGKIVGYDVDMAIRFCREYGYGLDIRDYSTSGFLPAISSGKADFGASCISVTEERKESMLFSDPNYNETIVIVTKVPKQLYSSIDELNGKRVGCLTGSIHDQIAQKKMKDVQIEYFNSVSDMSVALNTGKIDCYLADDPVARQLTSQEDNQMILGILDEDHFGTLFPKNSEKSTLLCSQINQFVAKKRADGSLEQTIDRWISPDSDNMLPDYDNLPAENGTLLWGISTDVGIPLTYVKDGKYAGYEIDLAVQFCREYGYGVTFSNSNFPGMIAAVASGKCDLCSSGISLTDERKESMMFSDPTYDGGMAVVVRKYDTASQTDTSFFESIGESFEKTFIREHRWKLFLSGIGVTLLITILSTIFGSVIGFALFLIYRKGYKVFVIIMDGIGYVIEKLPTVVILMILYYLIFGQLDISNMLVSVIGFTLLFTFSVLGLLKVSVGAIDNGQTEASLALGYTDNQTFLKIIFPQAVKHFIPGYKGAIVSLIKDTAIVGYIAVQDLTKISDIVRSRTYEAFFPLIATAVIYFVLAVMLIFIVKRIQLGTDPRRRKPEKIIKGVKK